MFGNSNMVGGYGRLYTAMGGCADHMRNFP